MVGVPTSGGCATCLKRSIKCDEARPSCTQCRRGGRSCPGYARKMKFVDEGPRLRRSTRKANVWIPGRPPTNSLNSVSLFSAAGGDLTVNSKLDNDNSGPASVCGSHSQGQCDIEVYQLRAPRIERDQIISSFVSALFPIGVSSVQRSFFGSWLWHVPPRLNCSEVLDCAALSLALAYFGRMSGDQRVVRNAELSYTVGLRRLAAAIADTSRRFDGDVLCATLLLGHYEALLGVNNAWIQHTRGAERLLQLRGARRCYDSAFEYSMFIACRGAIISEALASGKPCFLDAKDWCSIPDGLIEFPLLPQSPELYHSIFSHFAAIPGLLNKIKLVNNDAPESVRLYILSSAQTLRRDLREWYRRFTSADDSLRNPSLVSVSPVLDDYPFHSVYVYNDVPSATIITAYYAYIIALNNGMNCLRPDSNYVGENHEAARAICMSVDYCSHAGLCGTQTLRFSLPFAHSALPVIYRGWVDAWISRVSGILGPTMIRRRDL